MTAEESEINSEDSYSVLDGENLDESIELGAICRPGWDSNELADCTATKSVERKLQAFDTVDVTKMTKTESGGPKLRRSFTATTFNSDLPPIVGSSLDELETWGMHDKRSMRTSTQKTLEQMRSTRCCCACIANLYDRAQDGEKPRSWKYVHNAYFEIISSIVILFNAAFIGYSGSVQFRDSAFNEPKAPWIDWAEVAFCVVFTVELVLRFFAERMLLFFFGAQWPWNVLDCFLAVSSITDIVINGLDSGAVASVTIGRLLRLCRFIRIFRLTRVMKHFSSLRVIVFAMMNSISSLFWCLAVVGFIVYMFGVLLLYGLAEHFRVAGWDSQDDVSLILKEWYGGVYEVSLTLFMAICGGLDWADVYSHWNDLDRIYGWVFIAYIFVMHFGVLNVVVATFVRATEGSVAKDKDTLIEQGLVNLEDYAQKVTQFFKDADVEKRGKLSWDDFKQHMQNPHVKAYFQALDLDISLAHKLFELMDVDGDNFVSLDEFLNGCMRLRGGARNVDLNIILLHVERLAHNVSNLRRRNDKQLGILREMWKISSLPHNAETTLVTCD